MLNPEKVSSQEARASTASLTMNRRTDNLFMTTDLITGIDTPPSSPDNGGSTAPGRPFRPGGNGDLTLYQPPGGGSLDPVPGDGTPQNPDLPDSSVPGTNPDVPDSSGFPGTPKPDVPDSTNPYPSGPAPLLDDSRLGMYSAVVTLAPEVPYGSTATDTSYGLGGDITAMSFESSLLASTEFL